RGPPLRMTGAAKDSRAPATLEIDFEGNGAFAPIAPGAAIEHIYSTEGPVTAILRATDAAGGAAFDFASFDTTEPHEGDELQVAIVEPQAGAAVESELEVEALAWRADGAPPESVRFELDGEPLARFVAAPYRAAVDPARFAGRKATLAAVARAGGREARAEISVAFAPLLNREPKEGALLTSSRVL